MITVKQFIEQQKKAEWDLENPHLANLQDNEIVFIDGEPYIKTKVIFEGSQNPSKIAKIEDLELENMRLQLEIESLQFENEKASRQNESLQNFIYSLQRDAEREKAKHLKLHKMEEMNEKIKKLKDEKEELTKKVKELSKAFSDFQAETAAISLDAKINKAILLMQEEEYEENKKQTTDSMVEKMKRTIEVLQEQNTNLVKKNKKLRHAAQFFGEANNTIQKLNAQVQRAKTYFEKTDID